MTTFKVLKIITDLLTSFVVHIVSIGPVCLWNFQ